MLIKTIFTQPQWKPYYVGKELETLFDGFNEDEIIKKFIFYITNKISINSDNSLSIIELVIYEKIINTMISNIHEVHHVNFIQSLLIFYDGIPSISKVIEQRRRRIKNYLESNEKKILFKQYFDNLSTVNKKLFENLSKDYHINNDINQCKDTIKFDYFKWIKNRFSVDKSIGPSSNFIKKFELFIKIKMENIIPKINIYINSSNQNGESDLKIFKYISQTYNSGDFCIHTTDSDLIHAILVQQTYYKIINMDINFSVVKYLKLNNAQMLDANTIIKNIMETYNNINNTKTNNYKIIWDICLLFLFFGNDHLPSSIEIGPELGLEFFLKKHYIALGKNNIINLNKTSISLDLNNLLLLLEKINETKKNNITKIILQRYFKMNNTLISILVDKLDLDFNQIQEYLKEFIIFKANQLSPVELEKLDSCDLRKILKTDVPIHNYKFDNINNTLLEESLDYYNHDYMGLIPYIKPFNITNDPYQDLYNYISDKAIMQLTKQIPYLYDHFDINYHMTLVKNLSDSNNLLDSNDYLKKIFHLTLSQFGPMKDFHTDNLTFYKYNNVPSLEKLINFIKKIPENVKQTKIWLDEINIDNVKPEKYLNSINHHLLITPFISISTLPDEIKKIASQLNTIDNLWFNKNDFEYRDIDIKKFFQLWEKAYDKKITNNIINFNL